MAKSKRLQSLHQLACDVEQLCQRAGASRLLYELKLVAESEERAHRRLGARICGAKYRASIAAAVDYFVCKTVLEPVPPPKSWEAFSNFRRDYQLGQACRELIERGSVEDLSVAERTWSELGLDYGEDIAGS